MPTIKNQSPFFIAIVILGIMAIIMLTPTEAVFNKVINDDFKLEYVDLIFKMGLLFIMGYGFIRILKT
ncbi:MAG: hypothetical protein WBN69_13000, partial [Eudoraea sp.]